MSLRRLSTSLHFDSETVRVPSPEEVFADGEAILWTMPPDTLHTLFFQKPEGVELLYNFGTLLAQKLVAPRDKAPA